MIAWLWRKVVEKLEQPQDPYVEDENQIPGNKGVTADEVFYTAASRFLDVQVSINDSFDTRSTTAFSTGLTVLPLTFGLLRLSSVNIPRITLLLLAGGLGMYLVLVFCVWRASRIRVLAYRPNMQTLEEYSELAPGDELQRWVASEYVASTTFNQPTLALKGRWVGWGITALYAEGLLLSVAAISTLF